MSKRRKLGKHIKEETDNNSNNEDVTTLVCSECKDTFTNVKDASNHIIRIHYGLARMNDHSPFSESETIKVLIKAQKILKVLKCKNNGCGKTFRSGLGLKVHWTQCGKTTDQLTVNCEICGKSLKKLSLNSHMKIHNDETRQILESERSDETNGNDDDDVNHDLSKRHKRASAMRAKKFIRESCKRVVPSSEVIISGHLSDHDSDHDINTNKNVVIETILPNLTFEQKMNKILEFWKDHVVNPNDHLKSIPFPNDWGKTLATNGIIKCSNEGCPNEFTTITGLYHHYRRCGIDLSWKCKICDFKMQRAKRMFVKHLCTDHLEMLPPVLPELREVINKLANDRDKLSVITIPKPSSLGIVNHILEFNERHFIDKVFPDWIPTIDSWIGLREKEYHNYLPQTQESLNIKINTEQTNEWRRLHLFDSLSTTDHITFFVGGTVWSSEWCPLPVNANNFDQYIAIGVSINMDTTHTMNDIEEEKGLLQIWNCGHLERCIMGEVVPKLSICMAHSYGIIWDMEWCPGGTSWDDLPIADAALPRLGLLALACGDGNVRIHSIPHPDYLLQNYHTFTIFHNDPIALLRPPNLDSSKRTICKCISWIKSKNQNLIAAGYGSGIISIWDLLTRSPFLIVEESHHTILKPKYSWNAHSASVNCIKWTYNSGERFLGSCSFDRTAKLWDLRDLAIPITTIKKGLFTSIETHLQWCGLFMATDDCYMNFINPVSFKDSGYLNISANYLSTHKSCVWDISYSQWLNAEAAVDAAGEATIFPSFQPRGENKRKTKNRYPLFHITPCELKQNGNTILSKTDPKYITDSDVPLMRSYTEVFDTIGLIFHDFPLSNLNLIPEEECERIRLPNNMQYQRLSDYPMISINKVNWNCNYSSCTWLFTASQTGLCRLSCVSSLDPAIKK